MRCILFHDWGLWGVIETAYVMINERKEGVALTQERQCFRCRYTQIKISKALI